MMLLSLFKNLEDILSVIFNYLVYWLFIQIIKKQFRLLVKYEDLLNDTLNELKKIYDFLEIVIPDEDLKKFIDKFSYENVPNESKGIGKSIRFASPGHWKNLTDEEKEIIQKIMGKTLKNLGYNV